MYTDKNFTSYLSTWLIVAGFFATIFFTPKNLFAEGSVDFIDYPGYRLFYFAERPQQLKVYASAGEYINVGASHLGISSGFINIYRPDGTLHATYNNTGSSAGLGIINNNIEEINGPTGGGSTQGEGYNPGIVEVGNGQEGVWTVTLGYGFYQNSGFENLFNNEAWTRDEDQPTNRRVVLAWDITVSQNAAANEGGNMLTGRVFTNEYQSIVSENGNTTSPTFYLLTDEGFQFQIDYQDVDPWGFQIVSNNKGIISGDMNSTYSSFEQAEVERSEDLGSFDPNRFYQYEPQARDQDGITNNKVFFNLPDPNMPISATVTDIVREDTHTTWLLNETPVYNIEIINVELTSKDPANNNQGVSAVLDRTNGALITYEVNLEGTAQLVVDINNNGIFGDNEDRVVVANSVEGLNEIFWDGLDKNGQALDQQFNRELAYRLFVNAGELHLTLSDIENDLGGVKLTRLNGESPSSEFLYDHSRLGGAVSGGNLLPLPTTETFTFSNNFGDLKILDYWTYVSSVYTEANLILDIVDDLSLLAPDTDGDGVRDDSDLDDDNDGILDALETCPAPEGNNCFASNYQPDYDNDFDGIPNYADADDIAFDHGCADQNGDGRCDKLSLELDLDQDGVPNYIDLDADNDGIFDVSETLLEDADNDGFLYSGPIIVDDFGRVLLTTTSTANYITMAADNDSDGSANYLDRDSDNDGIHDVIESGHEDPEGDGVLSIIGDENVNSLGVIIAIPGETVSSFTTDKDGDILPDYLDLDSDNDGINDIVEGGNIDADNDGRLEGDANAFGQITLNGEILSTSFPTDNDGDGIPNYHDLDSDNDGIYDVVEGGNTDLDNDGLIGTGDPTIDETGRVTSQDGQVLSTSFPLDTDQDGIFDYEDLDSDNDGISDVYEANLSDDDFDGTIGDGEMEVDENGVVILNGDNTNTSNPVDTDGDGIPDFIDIDSDNDSLTDNAECPTGAPCPDNNGVGGPDFTEFTMIACPTPLIQPTVDHASSICDSETLSLTVNESSTYETAYPTETITYTWTNGNGVEIGTTTNPAFDITGNDPMLVLPLTVKVSVDVDCESPDSNPVSPEIIATPVANASSQFDRVCIGGEVQLLAPDVVGANYQWFFNTFPFSTSQNPIIQSLNSSTNFGLVVSLDGCESEMGSVLVIADEPPVIEALAGSGSYCSGEDVTFSAVNNNPDLVGNLNYILTGPDGLMVDVSVPADGTFEYTVSAVDFVNGGDYSLIVDNGSGCASNSENFTVEILEGPSQPVISALDGNVCPGEEITLTTQTYTGTNVVYTWILDGITTSTTNTPNFAIANASNLNIGNYAVRVDTGDGCGSSTSASVEVNVVDTSISPEIESNVAGNSACTGQSVNLRVINPTPETIYTWRNPNGDIINSDVMEIDITNIQITDAGSYTVEANIDGCVTLTDQLQVEVSAGLATPEFENNNLQACEGQAVNLVIDNFSTTSNTTFNWFNSNGDLVAVTTEPVFSFVNVTTAVQGNYFVVAESGECSSGQSVEANLVVNSTPNDVANAGLDESFCNGAVVSISANTPSVGTGQWTGNGLVFADANNPNTTVTGLADGVNTLTWTLSNGTCQDYSSDDLAIEIVTSPNEQASVLFSEITICEGSSLAIEALMPMSSFGSWVQVNGPTATILTPNDNESNVDFSGSGIYTFAWELSTADCGTFSSSNVVVTVDEIPADIANAGLDQQLCGTQINLSAFTPNVGTGFWTSTVGDIQDPTSPNTIVNNLPNGTHAFTWVLSNGTCQDYSSDEVMISISNAPAELAEVVNAQINLCADNTNGQANLVAIDPTLSIGRWVQNSGPNNAQIANDTESIAQVSGLMTGIYEFAWSLSSGDCIDYSSDIVTINVDEIPDGVTAQAGQNQELCGVTNTSLEAETPAVGFGSWSIFNTVGASVTDIMNPNTDVQLVEGENIFVWSLSNGGCQNYISDTIRVFLTNPDDVAEILTADIEICESAGNAIVLEASSLNTSTGVWSQTDGPVSGDIDNPTNEVVNINNLMPGSYTFQWTLSEGNCLDYTAANVNVSISELPNEEANVAQDELVVCDANQITLDATTPTQSTGVWTTNNDATIININQASTAVNGLAQGENTFVWSLSNGACIDYSQAAVTVFVEDGINAVNDNFTTSFGTTIQNENVLTNENLNGNTDYTLEVVGNSPEVNLNTDGTFSFTPANGFSGDYTFEYEICDLSCGICERALVTINVVAEPILECDVPNVLTPNNDNKNDALIIDCANQFDNNMIQIFNRWGDKVHEKETYRNDWRGTYEGEDLPAGTYFYVFKKDRNEAEAITGFITIIR